MAGGSEAGRRAFLRRVALFASLSDDDLGSLSRAGITDWARAGTAILKEGAPANGVIVLTEGRAKVVIAGQKGQDIILAIVEPLSVVGELALLDRSPRSSSRRATASCYVSKRGSERPPTCTSARTVSIAGRRRKACARARGSNSTISIEVSSRIDRPGRRVQLVSASLTAEGVEVCRASAWRIGEH